MSTDVLQFQSKDFHVDIYHIGMIWVWLILVSREPPQHHFFYKNAYSTVEITSRWLNIEEIILLHKIDSKI